MMSFRGLRALSAAYWHPFIITEHMLCLILAGLIGGLYGSRVIWWPLGALTIGAMSGFLSQGFIPIITWAWMLPLGAAVFVGLLVLSAAPIGKRGWLLAIFFLGFVVGFETDPEGVFFIDQAQTLGGLIIAGAILVCGYWLAAGKVKPPLDPHYRACCQLVDCGNCDAGPGTRF